MESWVLGLGFWNWFWVLGVGYWEWVLVLGFGEVRIGFCEWRVWFWGVGCWVLGVGYWEWGLGFRIW